MTAATPTATTLAANGPGTSPHLGRVLLWLFVTVATLYVALTRGHFVGTDEIQLYQITRSVWERGDISVEAPMHSLVGRGGMRHSPYNLGQALAAVPLYGLGRAASHVLTTLGDDWPATFSGPQIGAEPNLWGGDVEIFFVNLFNAFATAGLSCVVLLIAHRRLGARLGSATALALITATASYIGPFAVGFYRHSAEALFLLATIDFLLADRQRPALRSRLLAGLMMALMLHFRYTTAIAWPPLALFALWTSRQRHPGLSLAAIGRVVRELVPVGGPMVAAVLLHLGVSWLKFGVLLGGYELLGGNVTRFDAPLLRSLWAYLCGPSSSILLYSPLLVLAPWLLAFSWRRHHGLAHLSLALVAYYAVFYGKYQAWHGMWHFGPRYLAPLSPILLLPLASWLDHHGRRGWAIVAPLVIAGLGMTVLHVAVNWSYVFYAEDYLHSQPAEAYLFLPERSQVLAHLRALWAADPRVDLWLLNVYRNQGATRFLTLALPLLAMLAVSARRLRLSVRAART